MIIRLLLISVILLSCFTAKMTETVLYFGQSKPDGSMITAEEWNSFEKNYIPKVFKKGFSVIKIEGKWKDTVTKQLITEPTYQVICDYKRNPGISKQIDSLRYWYQKLFQQQSVLRVDKKVKASF